MNIVGWHRSEQGSLPLALIIVIAAAGFIAVLVSAVIGSQQQVRFDRNFTHALPVADAGIAAASFTLNSGEAELEAASGNVYAMDTFPIGESTVERIEEIDGQEYRWWLTRTGEMSWEAKSQSLVNGVEERLLVTEFSEASQTFLAAFADEQMLLRGANNANSYNSGTGDWCTGNGVVSSNELVEFKGGAGGQDVCKDERPNGRTVDRVDLYDWEDFPGDDATSDRPGGDRCDPRNHENCREILHNGHVFEKPRTFDDPLKLKEDTDERMAIILEALDGADDDPTDEGCRDDAEEFTASDDAPRASGGIPAGIPNGAVYLEPASDVTSGHPMADDVYFTEDLGYFYCFESLLFDEHTYVHPDASLDNPVIIVVDKEVIIEGGGSNAVDVGCVDCVAGTSTPVAGALQILIETGDFAMGNHAQFAGVLYGPRILCEGAGSNAQGHIYGSIICDEIDNQGGWQFHYDDALGAGGNGKFFPVRWGEESVP